MEWEKGCLVSVQQKSSICTKVMLGGRSPLRSPRVTSVYRVPMVMETTLSATANIDNSLAGGFHQQKHFQRKNFLQKNKSKLSNYMRKGPRLKGS